MSLFLILAAAGFWLLRAPLLGWAVQHYFAQARVDSRIAVRELDTGHVTAAFAIGPENAPNAQGVLTARFSGRQVTGVTIADGALHVRFDGKALDLGALQTLIDKFKPNQSGNSQFLAPGWTFDAPKLRLAVAMSSGALAAQGDAAARDGALTAAAFRFSPSRFTAAGLAATLRGGALRITGKDKIFAAMADAAADVTLGQARLDHARLHVQTGRVILGDAAAAPELAISGSADGLTFAAGTVDAVTFSFHGGAKVEKSGFALDGALHMTGQPQASAARKAAGAIPFWGSDANNRAALTANVRRLSFDAPRLTVTGHGGDIALDLPQPATVTGSAGAKLVLNAMLNMTSGGEGHVAGSAMLAGGGLPGIALATPSLQWRGGSLAGDVDARGAITAMMLRALAFDAPAHLVFEKGRLALSLRRCAPVRLGAYVNGPKPTVQNVAASVCASGPLLTAHDGAWTARAVAQNLSLDLPQATSRLERARVESNITGNAAGPQSGHVVLTTARLTDAARPLRYNPLSVAAIADLSGGAWRGTAALQSGKTKLADIAFHQETASGRGEAEISAADLAFGLGGLQPVDVSPLLAPVARAEGKARFAGHVVWDAATLQSRGRLDVDALTFLTPLGKASGFTTHIDFSSLNPLVTAAPAPLGVAQVEWLSPLTGTQAHFSLTGSELVLDSLVTHAAGGTVRLDPLRLKLSALPQLSGVLHLENIDLGQLVAGSNLAEKIRLDTRIDGTVPFAVDAEQLRIKDGHVAANRPGRISLQRSLWGNGGVNAMQDFAYQAMENLAFDKLDGTLNSLPEGRLGLVLHVVGRNDPATGGVPEIPLGALIQGHAFDAPLPLPKGTPIDLTLDTTLNFDELLRSYRSAWTSAVSAQQ